MQELNTPFARLLQCRFMYRGMKVRQRNDNQVLMDEQTFNRRTHPSLEYTLRYQPSLGIKGEKRQAYF